MARKAASEKSPSTTETVRSTLARGAVGALVGGAALGVANRLANRGSSRRKVLGARIPVEIDPRRLDASKLVKGIDAKKLASHVDVSRLGKGIDAKKLASHVDIGRLGKGVDVKDVLRRIGDLAEQVESRSEDVRDLSAQAKRLSRRMR